MKKEHDYLICIDSDGCAMDTMNSKHFDCFGPGMGKAVRLRRHPRRGIKILESDRSLFKNPWHQSLQRTCHGIRMGKRKRL